MSSAILVQACWRAMTAVLLKGRSVLESWSLEGHLAGHGARPVPERILHTLKQRCQLGTAGASSLSGHSLLGRNQS